MSLGEKLLGKTGVEIVAEDQNGVQGNIVVTKKGKTAKIGYLSVKPDSRGRGMGSQLLQRAEDWAKNKGVEEIDASIIPTPGSEKSILGLLRKKSYEVDEEKGTASKKL